MLSLGALAFTSPWMLAALAALPVLWWLLKVTPPAPKLLKFPAIRLLLGLREEEQTPAKTPLWLVILRTVLAAIIIIALAHPLLNPGAKLKGTSPLLLVVDDGWAAAPNWEQRKAAMDELLDQAERQSRAVMILTTAAPPGGAPLRASKLLRAAEARTKAEALEPKPWPTDRALALEALEQAELPGAANVVWLSDGIDGAGLGALATRLQKFGGLHVFRDDDNATARLLTAEQSAGAELAVTVKRAHGGAKASLWINGNDAEGRTLVRQRVDFAPGVTTRRVVLALPSELRNRLLRIAIEGDRSAGAVVLLDERWRRRPVGLIADKTTDSPQPLLNSLYYLERGLDPFSEIRKGPVAELLKRPIAVLAISDDAPLTDAGRKQVDAWIKRGGTAVRFAGPRLAQKPDELLPVKLRGGHRALGGAMSWSKPATLAPFDRKSPFAGLEVPKDVVISRQVLAQPSLDLAAKTWSRLTDGTPLVTAERRGRGWLVLVHTTANADWSNLALSGLFVEMLRRIVAISHGVTGRGSEVALPPLQTLDGFGRLQSPPASAAPIRGNALDRVRPGPKSPPGFYGNDTGRFALNLAAGQADLRAIANLPQGVVQSVYTLTRERDLKPWLLALALLIAVIDTWISLSLRGLLPAPWPVRGTMARETMARETMESAAGAILLAAALGLMLAATPALAQGEGSQAATGNDGFALQATLKTRLAYVRTGVRKLDDTSLAGLIGLSRTLTNRTSVEPAAPIAVDIERDELAFFPLLYWPVSPTQALPTAAARDRLNRYLRNGGTILFDTLDQRLGTFTTPGGIVAAGPGAARLRRILDGLDVPPLVPVPQGHILTKAFYLLQDFPGRWAGGAVWVQKSGDHLNDGVSPVVIGSNDWAAAWAVAEDGQPMFPVVPGGERQREIAMRFGVNLVMYTLTGNYKADQVHVPAILERLGQ